MNRIGKVYLVGAGPGDPGLFTLKGKEVLEKAQTVIYDYLANPELLKFCSKSCEFIYVGKKGGAHTLPQEEINKLLVDKAKEGKIVVRLKGGDPFLFGRGGEEIEELISENIPFEVIPGITSAIAVPAYAGIPVTHRNYTSTLAIITGHEAEDKEESKVNFSALAKLGTLVFLMGVKNLPHIVNELIRAGKREDTPCAVIQWGTTPKQKVATGTLISISEKVKEKGITAPAIIVVGEVVKLRERFNWFEGRPLFGKKILVTRTREQASKLSKKLLELGAEVIEIPTIDIQPCYTEEVYNTIKDLNKYDWLVFTSENGVKYFFTALFHLNLDLRALARVQLAVIGPATEIALSAKGLRADLKPEKDFTQEGLCAAFSKIDIKNKKILLIRAKKARELLPNTLQERGAKVDLLPIYETLLPRDSLEKLKEVLPSLDVITFTSSSTVENFFKLLEEGHLKISSHTLLASIGPITSDTLRGYGFSPHIEAKEYTISGLVKAIEEYFLGQGV